MALTQYLQGLPRLTVNNAVRLLNLSVAAVSSKQSISSYNDNHEDKEISYSDLKSLIKNSKDLLLVDVRSKDEVDKGRIPGSIHIPVANVEKEFSLDSQAFQDKFGVPKPPLEAHNLVFHCQLGRRGGTATDAARSLGFRNARNFTGGYKEWSEKEGK